MEGVDVVLHLAALIAIPFSYVAPRSYVETNVLGTLNVLEAVRRHGTSADGQHLDVGGLRHARARSRSPRRTRCVASRPTRPRRSAADKMCESYALSFEHAGDDAAAVQHLRPAPVGSRGHPDGAVAAARRGRRARLGDLTPKRDFTFVTDTADGFVRAAWPTSRPARRSSSAPDAPSRSATSSSCAARSPAVDAAIVTESERIRPRGSEVQMLLSDPTRAAADARMASHGLARGRPGRHGGVAAPTGRPRPPLGGTTDDRAARRTRPVPGDPQAPSRSRCRTSVSSNALRPAGRRVRVRVLRGPVRRGVRGRVRPTGRVEATPSPVRRGRPPSTSPSSSSGCARDDEVLCSDFTFVGSVNPIAYTGARPCSSTPSARPGTSTPRCSPSELDRRAEAGEPQPAAVEVVHVLGQPADLVPVLDACARHGVPVLEDAAESLGADVVRRRPSRAPDRRRRPDRRVLLQRQQDRDDRRRRHDRHRRRRPRRPRPPPDDPGEGARRRLPARRGRLQLPPHEHRRRPGPRPARAARRVRRAAKHRIAARYDEAFAAPAARRRRRASTASTRRTGSTRCSCPSPTARAGATPSSRTSPGRRGRAGAVAPAARPATLPPPPLGGGGLGDGSFARGLSLPCATELTDGDQDRVVDAVRSYWG